MLGQAWEEEHQCKLSKLKKTPNLLCDTIPVVNNTTILLPQPPSIEIMVCVWGGGRNTIPGPVVFVLLVIIE